VSKTSQTSKTSTTGKTSTLLALLLAVGCGYSPNPESGTLKCGTGGTCPEGYTCGLSNACWRPSDKPEPLIGCWLFDTNSLQRIDCSDNSTSTRDLSMPSDGFPADFVPILAGTESPLASDYWCPLELLVHGQSTQMEPNQDCVVTEANGDQFAQFPERFSFSTTNGSTARFEFSLSFDFLLANGDSGSCSVRTSGTLTKGTAVTCPPLLPLQSPPKN